MYFTQQDRKALRADMVILAQTVVDRRADHKRVDRALGKIEAAIINNAVTRDQDPNAASARVKTATIEVLRRPTDEADGANERIRSRVRAAAGRAFEREPNEEEERDIVPPGLPKRVHMAPELGVWTFTQTLERVACKQETPGGPFGAAGADEMFYGGAFTYYGPGLISPWGDDFDTGTVRTPGHVMVSVPVVPGTHKYEAVHTVAETDILGEGAATIVSVGLTFLLDLLIEIGIRLGRAGLKGWLMSELNVQAGSDEEDVIDEMLDEADEVADEAKADLMGVLAEWLAAALGPEVFPLMKSRCTINWSPSGWPTVTGISVVGSTSARGKPRVIYGNGAAIAHDISLRRSDGSDYNHTMTFRVTGHSTR